jgi:hypothetical protein
MNPTAQKTRGNISLCEPTTEAIHYCLIIIIKAKNLRKIVRIQSINSLVSRLCWGEIFIYSSSEMEHS